MVQLEPSGTATLPMRRVSAHSEKSTKDLGSLPVGHSTAMMRTRSVRVVRATLRLAGVVAMVVVRSRGMRCERSRRASWRCWSSSPVVQTAAAARSRMVWRRARMGVWRGWGCGDYEAAAAVAATLAVLLQLDARLAAWAVDAGHGVPYATEPAR